MVSLPTHPCALLTVLSISKPISLYLHWRLQLLFSSSTTNAKHPNPSLHPLTSSYQTASALISFFHSSTHPSSAQREPRQSAAYQHPLSFPLEYSLTYRHPYPAPLSCFPVPPFLDARTPSHSTAMSTAPLPQRHLQPTHSVLACVGLTSSPPFARIDPLS